MKLKLVVASMSVLGLVSCPAFAATKHVVHHHHHHHKMMNEKMETVSHRDYKDMGSMPVAAAPLDVCTISPNNMALDATTQNVGRAMPSLCNSTWYNRLQISGGINADFGKWGNRHNSYMGENYRRFSINDAYMNVSAGISDWAKAFASVSYFDASGQGDGTFTGVGGAGLPLGEYSAAYSMNAGSAGAGNWGTLQLEQGFVTMGNVDSQPFYLQVGKQYQDFGRYELHPITQSMTQVMSETLASSLKVGFIQNGFHGSVSWFDDTLLKSQARSHAANYDVALGYDQVNDQMGWGVGASYLYNIIGANGIAYNVVNWNTKQAGGVLQSFYNSRIGGVALYGDMNSGPFNIHARYTSALQRFSANDLSSSGLGDYAAGGTTLSPTARGAKPWTAGLEVGYGFEAYGCKNNVITVGYQTSHEAAGLRLPHHRYVVRLETDAFVYKNATLGVEWDHDKAYRGNNSNLVTLRAGVQFG